MKTRSNGHPRYCDCEGCERRKVFARKMGEQLFHAEGYRAFLRDEEEAIAHSVGADRDGEG